MGLIAVRLTKPLLSPWKDDDREPRSRGRPVAYHRVLVPLGSGHEAAEAMAVACRLAAERHAAVTALSVIEIPAELPLAALMLAEDAEARRRVSEARAIAELYGVSIAILLRRARSAGEAIVAEAVLAGSELIVIGTTRRPASGAGRVRVFGGTVDFVLKHAPCRVVVAALPREA